MTLARDRGFGYGPSKAASANHSAITPGWVNTDMGADGAKIEVEQSVHARATMESTGRFFEYDGTELPW